MQVLDNNTGRMSSWVQIVNNGLYQDKRQFVNKYTRGIFFLAGDIIAVVVSALLANIILSPFSPVDRIFPIELVTIIGASILGGLAIFRMYVVSWKYTSLRDLLRMVSGIILGGAFALLIAQFYLIMGKYVYVFTMLMVINVVLAIGSFRIAKRICIGIFSSSRSKKKHAIIFGGKSEGEQILRDILVNKHWDLAVYGIFDGRVTPGLRLHGVPVLGGETKMVSYVKNHPVDQLIVAFPEFPKNHLKVIIEEVKLIRSDIDIKVLPSFHSLTDDPVGIKHIRDICIEDILGREPVNIDISSISKCIANRTVLITGAGGSIGSELVRQCASLKPSQLIALDIDETELFHLENEFKDKKISITPCVASITDKSKINQIFHRFHPDIIFHAAAYKHVPMMESFPEEAIKVNIGGTLSLAKLACRYNVDKFVMVSTDKAVNPTNVMGATKRAAEKICMAQNNLHLTRFISVRFGNVLGSRGSVVPLFIEQISQGGPVSVTDPDIERYFMTIPEAVLLVMQAGSMGEGGEVFVLNMGESVKILDMAKDLIRLHNLSPGKDIDIEIIGLRPGEKLFEELLNAEEDVMATEHSEISKALCDRKISVDDLEKQILDLFSHLGNGSTEDIREYLKLIVPTYSFKKMDRRVNNNLSIETQHSSLIE